MNKGIIIEKHLKYSIVLTSDGSFEKAVIQNEKADIGEEVSYHPYSGPGNYHKNNMRMRWKIRSLVCAVLFTIFAFSSVYFSNVKETYAYITIDFNPSIEIQVDRKMNVRNISAINEKAEQLLVSLPGDDEDLYTTISHFMDICEQDDALRDQRNIFVGISYVHNKQGSIAYNIKNTIATRDANWEVTSFHVPPEIRERALANNTSMNKEFALLINEKDNHFFSSSNLDELKKERIHSFYAAPDNRDNTER